MKKLLVYTLAFLMLFSSVPVVFSLNVAQPITNDTIYDYIADVIPLYLLSAEQDINPDAIYTTQGYSVQNLDNTSSIYFLFENDRYFGRLIVDQIDGSYCSSFMFDENETIESLVASKTPFLLLMPAEETLLAVWNEGYDVIGDTYETDIDIHILPNAVEADSYLNPIQPCLTQVESAVVAHPNIDTSNDSVSLNVDYVENKTSDAGAGLCWAASIAAISNFRKGTNWGAYPLYSALKSSYDTEPIGTMTWYKRAFEYLNMTYASAYGVPTWQMVYNTLNISRPIMMTVERTESGSTYAHAIVCTSFIGGDGYAVFGFMDPNHSDTQFVTFSDSTLNMSNFTYVSATRTYSAITNYIY